MKNILIIVMALAIVTLAVSTLFAQKKSNGKPIIGISSYSENGKVQLNLPYVKSVRAAGGIALVIPVTCDEEQIEAVLDHIDGLVMTGGDDVDPQIFGEQPHPRLGAVGPERDRFDIMLIQKALKKGLPIMGICRGEQLLNVAMGGTMIQDIPSQVQGAIKHRQDGPRNYASHAIKIEKGSLAYKCFGSDSTSVNSFHHQAVAKLAPGLKVTAVAPDGVIEIIEKIGDEKVFGVQFHPEGFVAEGDMRFLPLFKHLVEMSSK